MYQVDAFIVVHAGQGAERTGDAIDLWSVKWTLPKAQEADGLYSELCNSYLLTHSS